MDRRLAKALIHHLIVDKKLAKEHVESLLRIEVRGNHKSRSHPPLASSLRPKNEGCGFTPRSWPGQTPAEAKIRSALTNMPALNGLALPNGLTLECRPKQTSTAANADNKGKTVQSDSKCLRMRDSPPISQGKPLPDAPIEQPPGLYSEH